MEHLGFNLLYKDLPLADILSMALWPILVETDNGLGLRNIDTTNPYCMFKQIWGKSKTTGTDLEWFREELEEVGVPLDEYYCAQNVHQHSIEFERVLNKFQQTGKRAGHGVVGLLRNWKNMFTMPQEFITVARSLPLKQELKWENAGLADQCQREQ